MSKNYTDRKMDNIYSKSRCASANQNDQINFKKESARQFENTDKYNKINSNIINNCNITKSGNLKRDISFKSNESTKIRTKVDELTNK